MLLRMTYKPNTRQNVLVAFKTIHNNESHTMSVVIVNTAHAFVGRGFIEHNAHTINTVFTTIYHCKVTKARSVQCVSP